MDDLSPLYTTDEEDFVHLVQNWDGEILKEEAEKILGKDWKTKGLKILKTEAPDLAEKLNAIE